MDLDRLDPEMAPGAGLQLFAPDPNYELLPQTGWWTRYGKYLHIFGPYPVCQSLNSSTSRSSCPAARRRPGRI